MRVLHVTDSFLPRCGGIEHQVRDLTTHQRALGVDARVLTATPSPPAGRDPAWVLRIPRGRPVGRFGGAAVRQAGPIRAELLAADVVHCHLSVVSPFAIAVARHAANQQIPTVLTVHSLWNYPALGRLTSTMLGRHDTVRWSAVSTAAAERVTRALGPAAEVIVTPNAVELDYWAGPPGRLSDPTPAFVSVMRFARRKRPLALARMLRAVADRVPAGSGLTAVIIGDGPQRPDLERYLANHRMDTWVRLTGHLDRSAIRHELARSSLFVAPAVLESFGIAALEARTAGLPVIASSHGGVGTYITHGTDGALVDDDDEMVAAMIRFVVDTRYRRSLIEGAQTPPRELGWDAAIRRFLDLYRDAGAEAAPIAARHNRSGSRPIEGEQVA